MKIRNISFLAVGAVMLLFGCGGSGAGSVATATLGKDTAREAVREAAGSVKAVQSSRSRLAKQASSRGSALTREGGGGEPGCDPGSDNGGVWYKTMKEEYGFANGNQFLSALEIDMFSDPEHTNKIGYQSNYTRYEDTTGFGETDYHFTSGPQAPYRLKTSGFLNPNSGNSLSETLLIAKDDEGRITETKTKFTQASWESRSDFEISFSVGGSRYLFVGFAENGVVESNWTNSLGYRIQWRVNSDGSGTIRLENANNPLCPATGTYGVDGTGTLTFADGSQESFDMNSQNFWQ